MKLQKKLQLAGLILIIAILCSLLIFSSIQKTKLQEEKELLLINEAKAINGEINRIIQQPSQNVHILADNLKEVNSWNPAHIQEYLENVGLIYGIYEDISFIDTQGNVIASTSFSYVGDWKTKEWFIQGLERFTISNPHYLLNPKRIVIEFVAPVHDQQNNLKGVVSIRLPFSHIEEIVQEISTGVLQEDVYLINDYNQFLMHTQEDKVLSAPNTEIPISDITTTQGTIYYEKNKTQFISGFYVNENFSAKIIVVEEQKREIFKIIRETNVLIAIISLVIFTGLFMSYIFVGKKFQRIKYLDTQAKKIGEGNYPKTINTKGDDELSTLAKSLFLMNKKIQKREKELIAQKEKVNKLLALKNKLIVQIGHDIKTPLTPMKAQAQLIQAQTKNSKIKKEANIIEKNTNHLLSILEETNVFTQLQENTFSKKKQDINPLITKLVQRKKTSFGKRKVDLKISKKPLLLNLNEEKITQALDQLITNAIEFTSPTTGKISITTTQTTTHNTIIIKDNGRGFGDTVKRKLFEYFFKEDDNRNNLGGFGLGLPIAKKIIQEIHKGKLLIQSKGPKQGTTVTIRFRR